MKELSNAELVTRTRDGDRRAFGQLAKRHEQIALSIAVNMVGNLDTAQELIQDAMLQAYLSLNNLKEPDLFRAWLLGIVRNLCRKHWSSQSVLGLSLDVLAMDEHRVDPNYINRMSPNPHQETETKDLYGRILKAINALSKKNRMATLLFYYKGFSHREIANQLGVSENAVKSCLFRARSQLAGLLAPICPEFVAHKPRSIFVTELTVVDVVALSQRGYCAVMMLDEAGKRVLPVTVTNRTRTLIQESMKQAKNRSLLSDKTKILVVDDEQDIRQMLSNRLKSFGYEVITATNGREGLDRIEADQPDLVMVDLRMPVLDGFHTCRWIKAKQAHAATPAILAIATDKDRGTKALEAGADDYVLKPFQPQDLQYRIESLLEMHQKDRPAQISDANDFTAEILKVSGGVLDEVRLEPLYGDRFIAVAKIRNGKKTNEVETWPDSAIALAVRTRSPIYASEAVLETTGKPISEDLERDSKNFL